MAIESPIYVTSPGLPPFDEYVDEIRSVWDSRILTHQGPKYIALEGNLKQFLDVKYAPLFANGHLALQIALRAIGACKGEVITTPFTFASTTMAIVESGLTPVFCDIDPDDFTIDHTKIKSLISENTVAILPVHVYGLPCHVDQIQDISKQYGIRVVYDAAHAFGESINGRNIATFGDMSMFSLHATKVYNSVEGGVLAFNNDEDLYDRVCAIRQFGEIRHSPDSEFIGTNAKMTELHAAMGICNLRHLDEYIAARKAVFEVYTAALGNNKNIRCIQYPENLRPNYAYFPIIISDKSHSNRDQLMSALEKEGVLARKYFYPLTNQFSAFRNRFPLQDTPIAKDVSNRVLCLPIHPNMTTADAESIARIVIRETT